MSDEDKGLSQVQVQEMIKAAVAESREQHGIETRLAFSQFEKQLSQDIDSTVKRQISESFSAYFGKVEPHEHITDHFRISKMLKFFENFNSSIWSAVITFGLKALGLVGVIYIVLSLAGPAILKSYITDKVKAETTIEGNGDGDVPK